MSRGAKKRIERQRPREGGRSDHYERKEKIVEGSNNG